MPFASQFKLGLLAGCLSMLSVAAHANTDVLDFNSLTGNGIDFQRGFSYTEDGYLLENLATNFPFASVHEGDFRYFGSVHFYNNAPEGVTRLSHGGQAFSLDAIDLQSLNGNYAVNVTFTGQASGGGTVTQTFTTDDQAGFQTFTFGNAFKSVTSVTWVQGNPYHYFDNITVSTAVPEPEAFTMFAAAVMGLLAFKRIKAR